MKIQITIDNKLRMDTKNIPQAILKKIKNELSTINPEYLKFLKRGKRAVWLDEKINHYWESDGIISMPRGFINNLQEILKPYKPQYSVKDITMKFPKINIKIKKSKDDWEFQNKALGKIEKKEFGIIVFPTGAGKTITAIKTICLRKQPTLIVVHTKLLLHQWKEKILQFTNIEEDKIGLIGDGKKELGEYITIGIVNSLGKVVDNIKNEFGMLIIDECHRTPASTFSKVASRINSYYILGLTATPKRSDGQSNMINFYCGNIIEKIEPKVIQETGKIMIPKLIIRKTGFTPSNEEKDDQSPYKDFKYKIGKTYLREAKNIPAIFKTELNFFESPKESTNYMKILSEIVINENRNNLIKNDVIDYLKNNKNGVALVISDRIEHCNILFSELSKIVKTDLLTSKTKETFKDSRIIVATSQLIGEGFDCPKLSALFLTTPISWQYRLIQYVGRILRIEKGKDSAIIYDYLDDSELCYRMFERRKPGYRKQGIKNI